MSHAVAVTGSDKKERPLSGGQLGNTGRAGKIFTLEAQERFLQKYRKYRNVDRAARAIGFRGTTVFRQVHKSKRFAAQYDAVRAEIHSSLDEKLHNFALGVEVPVHNSQITAIFGVLRAYKPERYRENMKLSVGAEGDFAALLKGMAAHLLPVAERKNELPAIEHKGEKE